MGAAPISPAEGLQLMPQYGVAVAFYIQTEDILYITSVYMLYTVVAVIFIKVYINMYI